MRLPETFKGPFAERGFNLAFALLLGCLMLEGVGLLILAANVAWQMLGGSGP